LGRGAPLLEEGRRLFFGETFGGNGRICGTCHPAQNNYTLDPAYIARLPARDPLFVAEYAPRLRDLERPKLLRRLALIAVNVDGFDKPAVLRGVPTLLGIARALRPEPGSLTLPGASRELADATGWSGDGAPGRGSLKEFAVGAIRQHLTRSLARRPGIDFRLPDEAELQALEAFLRSLGRSDELDIADFTGVTFRSPLVERGRRLFNNEASGSCATCHRNATALDEGGFNGMFDIGVIDRADSPARRLDPTLPGDGGFGSSLKILVAGHTGFGDRRMNTPSLIEAADTSPFFHDNSAATIEAAVHFYTTSAFAASLDGQTQPTVRLTPEDEIAVAALLRTLNALENIRSSSAFLQEALAGSRTQARELLRLAGKDTWDALRVLTTGPRPFYPRPVRLIRATLTVEWLAMIAPGTKSRNWLLRRAIAFEGRARAQILNP
jgi:hypothetical protein